MDLQKIREVMRWRDSDVFLAGGAGGAGVRRGDEHHALTVTDEMVALLGHLGEEAVVELTMR